MSRQFSLSRRAAGLLAGTAVLAMPAVTSSQAADAANGEQLAKRWCAACHIVASGQTQGNAQVPTFAAIAKKPNFDAQTVAFFLLAPHPQMPSMSLSRAEAADLAAFIATQK